MAFNDTTEAKITQLGRITITADGIECIGFDADGAGSCREVGILAAAWAIGELQKEMLACMLKPGGNLRMSVD